MGLVSEVNIVIRHIRRYAIYKKFIGKGFSSDQARAESNHVFPMTDEDIEFENYLIQTNKHVFSRVPWISCIALLYPIHGVMKVLDYTSAPLFVFGYGLGQLGYLLLFAGIVSGKFGVLNLNRRAHTLLFGVLSLASGTILSSIAN